MASPLLSITVEETVTQAFAQLEREADEELRALASQTGIAIRDTARASVPVAEGVTRDHIVSEDRDHGTFVFVQSTPDRPTNLDLWLEVGTSTMEARPFLNPAALLHQARFEREVEQILRRVIDRVSR